MLICKKSKVLLIFFALFILLQVNVNAQRTNLNKNYSFKFTGHTVSEALQIISSVAKVSFSYDPNVINENNIITANFVNKPLSLILENIISNKQIKFKEIGNQIVLYQINDTKPTSNTKVEKKIIPDKIENITKPYKPDTIIIHRSDTLKYFYTDTLTNTEVRIDTIQKNDTILRIDTVLLDKNFVIIDSLYLLMPLYKKGFFIEANIAFSPFVKNDYIGTEEQKILNNKSITFPNVLEAGLAFGYQTKKSQSKIGVNYLTATENFNYTYIQENSGFFQHDTIETYYSVTNNDTVWFYITDSTWVPTDFDKVTVDNKNKYSYIKFSYNFQFNLLNKQNWNWYAGLGAGIQIPLNVKANFVDNIENNKISEISKSNINKIQGYGLLSTGFRQKLNTNFILFEEVAYYHHFKETFSNINFYNRNQRVSFKIGLQYKW